MKKQVQTTHPIEDAIADKDPFTEPCLMHKDDLAELFEVTPRRIEQMAQEGILEPVERRPMRFDLIPTIQALLEYQRTLISSNGKDEEIRAKKAAKLAAEVRYKEAKAESMELRLKEQKGQLHRAEDIKKITGDHLMTLRGMLLALPGQLAVDVSTASSAMECSEIIKKAVYQILNDLADYDYNSEDYRQIILERYGITGNEDEEDSDQNKKRTI